MTPRFSFKLSLFFFCLFFVVFNTSAQIVRFSEVSKTQLQPRKRVVGTLKAFNQATIASAESGKVIDVTVNEGDRVQAGEILATLDTRRLNAQKSRLEAEKELSEAHLALAKAEFAQSEKDFLAYKQSALKSAVSQQLLGQSETLSIANQARVIAAQQAVKALDAQLNAVQISIDDMSISAPFSGQVSRRFAEPGQWLGTGSDAFTITSLDKLEVWLDVPERFALLAKNSPNTIALKIGDQLINADNIKVLSQVDERARTFQIIGEIKGQNFMPGMSVSAWLPEGKERATLTIPKDALVHRNGNDLVYKIVTEGDQQIAQPISVDVQFHQGNYVAVYAPQLAVKDKIITEGNERLMPGPVMAVADSSNASRLK